MSKEIDTSDIIQDYYPLQPKKRVEIQDPNPTHHVLLSVTEIQDKFAELVSQVPVKHLTLNKAAQIYKDIPGVKAKFNTARKTASGLMNREDVCIRIRAYRKVFGTSKERLLVERELLTNKIETAWNDREMYPAEGEKASASTPVVRTSDVLTAYKDRESAHGIHAETVQKHIVVKVQSANPQDLIKEAEDIIDAEVITDEKAAT